MYRIIDGRGTGKTSRLLLLAKENNGIVVCKHPEKMREKAHIYGLTGIDFISYEDYHDGYYQPKPIFIDELDVYLTFLDYNIAGYTISED
jgi:hypothetical protein